jgi:hypothetical protein
MYSEVLGVATLHNIALNRNEYRLYVELQRWSSSGQLKRCAHSGNFSQDERVIANSYPERSPGRVPEYLRL